MKKWVLILLVLVPFALGDFLDLEAKGTSVDAIPAADTIGEVYLLNGDAYIDISDKYVLPEMFTIDGWIFLDNTDKTQLIVGQQSSMKSEWAIYYDAAINRLVISMSPSGSFNEQVIALSHDDLKKKKWHYFAAVKSDNLILYLDGKPGDPVEISFSPGNSDIPTYIGQRSDMAAGLIGAVSRINIYERVMAELEMQNHAQLNYSEFSCVPNWQCSEWSACMRNKQTRNCADLNKCATDDSNPEESISCGILAEASPVSICGNTVIEDGETPETCCIDVGCISGYDCIDNLCIESELNQKFVYGVLFGVLMVAFLLIVSYEQKKPLTHTSSHEVELLAAYLYYGKAHGIKERHLTKYLQSRGWDKHLINQARRELKRCSSLRRRILKKRT